MDHFTAQPQTYRSFSLVYDRHIRHAGFAEESDYYGHYKDRYWRTFQFVELCATITGQDMRSARVLDIGSGQFAILCRRLLDTASDVLDIDTRHVSTLEAHGVGFIQANLVQSLIVPDKPYDLIVMAEVIEHVPTPPYLVFRNLFSALRPGGCLLLTTPNLYRLRNVFRMITGRQIFDTFMLPEKDRPLGHFIEYAREQIEWHLREVGFAIRHSSLEQLTLGGNGFTARWGRRLLCPLVYARPLWREHIVVIAQRPMM